MNRKNGDERTILERFDDTEAMTRAVRRGVREALRRHMLLGESVVVADDAAPRGVRILGPDELRRILDAT